MVPRTALSNDQIKLGMATLLDRGLAVHANDEAVVLHDESVEPYIGVLTHELIARDVSATLIRLPIDYQVYLANKIEVAPEEEALPHAIKYALNTATVILNMLAGSDTTGLVRGSILQQPRAKECRLAHIPGLSDAVLSVVSVTDFDAVLSAAEQVSWVLGNGGRAELITSDSAGGTYTLTMNLGGWHNEPLMSPGIIPPGSWGNFPPGETFCCPDARGVSGTVCINGSVPGHLIGAQEEVILHFRDGRLERWTARRASKALEFFCLQEATARAKGDANWNVFAELGIGLNQSISALTGNSLFDEKAARTVHIAIGDNTIFGHDVVSHVHLDLVICNPTLVVDGLGIIADGELLIGSIMRRREGWQPPRDELPPQARVWMKEEDVEVDGAILLRRLCKADRIGYVRMADDRTASALKILHSILKQQPHVQLQALYNEYPRLDNVPIDNLIKILHHYNCIELELPD